MGQWVAVHFSHKIGIHRVSVYPAASSSSASTSITGMSGHRCWPGAPWKHLLTFVFYYRFLSSDSAGVWILLPSPSHCILDYTLKIHPGGSAIKNPPAMQETRVRFIGQEDRLEKGMATHSSVLVWRIRWAEEPGGLQTTGSQRVGHDWVTSLHFASLQLWRRWRWIISDSICYLKTWLIVRIVWIIVRNTNN